MCEYANQRSWVVKVKSDKNGVSQKAKAKVNEQDSVNFDDLIANVVRRKQYEDYVYVSVSEIHITFRNEVERAIDNYSGWLVIDTDKKNIVSSGSKDMLERYYRVTEKDDLEYVKCKG
jgi:3-methyladenine DNA glycosylase AlkD